MIFVLGLTPVLKQKNGRAENRTSRGSDNVTTAEWDLVYIAMATGKAIFWPEFPFTRKVNAIIMLS